MIATYPEHGVAYYKRYRMEMDLIDPLPSVPALARECRWIPWERSLLWAHASVKFQCFRDDLDGQVFPNLASRMGCERLMREISARSGFRPQSTWLIADGDAYVGTVQGVADWHGTGSIQNLGVIPSHRSRGLGMALLLQALHGFRLTGLCRAALEVTAQNEIAIRMYRQVGFRFRKTLYKVAESTAYPIECDAELRAAV
jgi:ribosomal protein S18 acetylase RimI-like enzyme